MSVMNDIVGELLGETALEKATREQQAWINQSPAEQKKEAKEKQNAAKGILTPEAMAKMLADGTKAAAKAKVDAADYTAPYPTQEQAGFKPTPTSAPAGLTPAAPVIAPVGMSMGNKVAIIGGSVGVIGLILLLVYKLSK